MLYDCFVMDMSTEASYQIDTECRIVRASDAFCRLMRCAEAGLVGRDAHDLVRGEWRPNYGMLMARARDGASEIAVPLIAPCGLEGWFIHTMEAVRQNGAITGYRATVVPRTAARPLAKAS